MATLKKFYENMENPLENDNVLEKIIEIYNDPEFYNGVKSMYSGIAKANTEKTNRSPFQIDDKKTKEKDLFFSKMFNRWKSSITSTVKDGKDLLDYSKMEKQAAENFINMRSYLMAVPDASTLEKVNYITNGHPDNKINEIIQKYNWNSPADNPISWQYVISNRVEPYGTAQRGVIDNSNVEHRLYINTDSSDVYEMANKIVDKMDGKSLPYYFKFTELDGRDDNLILYVDTKNLLHSVDALNEISIENPELISRCGKTPLLSGKVNDWIGYGSESKTQMHPTENVPQSFNYIRAEIFDEAMFNTIAKTIKTIKYLPIESQGNQMLFHEYMSGKLTNACYKAMDRFSHTTKNQESGDLMNDKNSKAEVKEKLNTAILQDDLGFLRTLNEDKDKLKGNFSFENPEGNYHWKTIPLHNDIYYALQDIIEQIIKKTDKSILYENFREEINAIAKNRGIDPNNFCFDEQVVQSMKNYHKKQYNQQNQEQNLSGKENQNNQKNTASDNSGYSMKKEEIHQDDLFMDRKNNDQNEDLYSMTSDTTIQEDLKVSKRPIESITYSLGKEKIIQNDQKIEILDMIDYQPMNDNEIKESKEKLGF